MRSILLLATLALVLPFPSAAAEPTCVDALCAHAYDEGDDCTPHRAEGTRGQWAALGADAAQAWAAHEEYCFAGREGGVVSETVAVGAATQGAMAGVEVRKAEDRYWGDLEWRYREVRVFAELPSGNRVEVYHAEGGFTSEDWPDPPFCVTGASVDDEWVDVFFCPGVAPLFVLP